MKASELIANNYFKGLIYGDSGVGKTVLAASFPGPIEYWDFDHKLSSAVGHFTRTQQTGLLDNIDVHQFGALTRECRIPAWEVRSKAIDDCVREKKALPFKTLVLDSLTTFTHYMLEDYIYRSQRGLKRSPIDIPCMQDYMLLDKHLTRIITGILSLDCNVVMLGHLGVEKDESSGAILRQPLMTGKFATKLPIFFEEVYVARMDAQGNRVLQTTPEGGFIARSQRGYPKQIPMNIKELI